MHARTLLLMLVLSSVAGCAEEAPPEPEDEPGAGLKATDDTGVIRGVVVDAAIVPVAGVDVRLDDEGSATTDEDGFFAFSGVTPGSHFLEASKAGWGTVQTSVQVVAGVDRPDIVKIQLEPDPSSLPRVQPLSFEGIIVCSFSVIAAGHATCSTLNLGDEFLQEYGADQLGGDPDFVQSEMVWESTQQGGSRMSLLYSAQGDSTLLDNYAEATGESPIMVSANRTALAAYDVPGGQSLMIRVFNAAVEGTDLGETIGDPTDGDDCFDRPVLGGCTTGIGATIDQTFTVYTHAFFGFEPDEGWRFSEHGEPIPPSFE